MKTCFVIAPIGEEGTETRKRSDLILDYILAPACTACGYEPVRADRISEPGLITSQVIQHIMDDPLVIADLTERNPNVFYELAIRHVLRKPFVQIIRKGDPIPFDVAATRTIPIDHQDLRSVAEAKDEIIKQIRAAEEKQQNIESPISTAIDIQSLRQSDRPEQRTLVELIAAVTDLRQDFLEYFISAPDKSFFTELADRVQESAEKSIIMEEQMFSALSKRFEVNSQILTSAMEKSADGSMRIMHELSILLHELRGDTSKG